MLLACYVGCSVTISLRYYGTMSLCYHVATSLCGYVNMLLCYYAKTLLVAMLLRYYAATMLVWYHVTVCYVNFQAQVCGHDLTAQGRVSTRTLSLLYHPPTARWVPTPAERIASLRTRLLFHLVRKLTLPL